MSLLIPEDDVELAKVTFTRTSVVIVLTVVFDKELTVMLESTVVALSELELVTASPDEVECNVPNDMLSITPSGGSALILNQSKIAVCVGEIPFT